MANLYYKVWVDAIKAAIKANKDGQNNWRFVLIITFSVAQGFNLLTILLFVKVITKKEVPFININFFPGQMLDIFISSFITLFLPFILLNYYLIFYQDKYKELLNGYKRFKLKEGLVFVLYFIISIIVFALPGLIVKLIF